MFFKIGTLLETQKQESEKKLTERVKNIISPVEFQPNKSLSVF